MTTVNCGLKGHHLLLCIYSVWFAASGIIVGTLLPGVSLSSLGSPSCCVHGHLSGFPFLSHSVLLSLSLFISWSHSQCSADMGQVFADFLGAHPGFQQIFRNSSFTPETFNQVWRMTSNCTWHLKTDKISFSTARERLRTHEPQQIADSFLSERSFCICCRS